MEENEKNKQLGSGNRMSAHEEFAFDAQRAIHLQTLTAAVRKGWDENTR